MLRQITFVSAHAVLTSGDISAVSEMVASVEENGDVTIKLPNTVDDTAMSVVIRWCEHLCGSCEFEQGHSLNGINVPLKTYNFRELVGRCNVDFLGQRTVSDLANIMHAAMVLKAKDLVESVCIKLACMMMHCMNADTLRDIFGISEFTKEEVVRINQEWRWIKRSLAKAYEDEGE
jgi:hypothetical protein